MHCQNGECVYSKELKKLRSTKEKAERPTPMKKTSRQKMVYKLLLMVTWTMKDTTKLSFHWICISAILKFMYSNHDRVSATVIQT